jgi:hypothetical protein
MPRILWFGVEKFIIKTKTGGIKGINEPSAIPNLGMKRRLKNGIGGPAGWKNNWLGY